MGAEQDDSSYGRTRSYGCRGGDLEAEGIPRLVVEFEERIRDGEWIMGAKRVEMES